MPTLNLQKATKALRQFPTYEAIDIFVDDIDEFVEWKRSNTPPPGLQASGEENVFIWNDFILRLFAPGGVLRISRKSKQSISNTTNVLVGGAVGAAIGAATDKKGGDRWVPGLVLGVLVGAMLSGGENQNQPRSKGTFSLRFDEAEGKWKGYDGGLIRWAKTELYQKSGS